MPKYASLHAGLLARKGEAQPAPVTQIGAVFPAHTEVPEPPVEPARPDLRSQPPPASEKLAELRRHPATARHKTTVRLNDEQRRRVRLAAVQLERSQQSLISEAIDDFLDRLCERELPHCHCLKKR
ncbi:MAG: hypothetical protein VX501_03970 [Pseudomonadota bacterium]|nr:hypothetical protein [Pseudomonadota bacterium]